MLARSQAEKDLADANAKLLIATETLQVRNRQLTAASEELRMINEGLEQRIAERTAQLRALANDLTQTEERERRRIAKILHDDLQQLLVAARMRLETAQKRMGAEERQGMLRDTRQLITEAIGLARDLSHDMSLVVLHEQGLSAAMGWMAKWMEQNHGLKVSLEADGMTDPADENLSVALFQSARELLFNVTKHAGVKEAELKMSRSGDGGIEIVVSDKGAGFDPAQAGTRGAKGASLGLFSIRERLELLGARMEVESAPGLGARFRLVASLEGKAGGEEKMETRGAPGPQGKTLTPARMGAEAHPARIRVLLADDHKMMREGLANILAQEEELEIVGLACDGQEAVEQARKLQPDVLITDISLPGMDGIEVARLVTKTWPRIRVIGLTMHGEGYQHEAMREAGALKCLVKTGSTEELIKSIITAARGG
jgi:signal transduction histidine kinase/CheY-like chemotaxis protein